MNAAPNPPPPISAADHSPITSGGPSGKEVLNYRRNGGLNNADANSSGQSAGEQ
ncbi:hypothetical protein [Klebsiella pneumoniae IS46]|nr:hypothetical protein [Klebsiella pneumoniae IS46]